MIACWRPNPVRGGPGYVQTNPSLISYIYGYTCFELYSASPANKRNSIGSISSLLQSVYIVNKVCAAMCATASMTKRVSQMVTCVCSPYWADLPYMYNIIEHVT